MQISKIFLDLDGCFANFDGKVREYYKEQYHPKMWNALDKIPHLFRDLKVLLESHRALGEIDNIGRENNIPIAFLTALPKPTNQLVTAAQDKLYWVRNHLKSNHPVYCSAGWRTKVHWVEPGAILIDDMTRNCEMWVQCGGIPIKHHNWSESLEKLRSLTDK